MDSSSTCGDLEAILSSVPEQAARAYADAGDRLVPAVNRSVAAHPRLRELIGENHLQVMEMNHRNHHRFVSTVLQLADARMLCAVVPWVYRSYHAHGFSLEYFPVHLAAWREALRAELPAECSSAILPLYDWMIGSHDEMSAQAMDAGQGPAAAPLSPDARGLLNDMVTGDDRHALETAHRLAVDPPGLSRFYIGTLQPALVEIGRLWEAGRISTAIEHLATGIAGRIMASLYARITPPGRPSRGTVLVTCAPNEFHEVGARMFSDLLELEGWRTVYLGSNTPADDLLAMVRDQRPDVLAISVCMAYGLGFARDIIREARALPGMAGLKVLAGGQAFRLSPGLWQRIGADACAAGADEGVAAVCRLTGRP